MSSILEKPLNSIMKTNMPMIKKEEKLSKAIEIMQTTGIHFVSVVDGFKTLIGTLSERDILKAFQISSIMGGTIKISEEFFVQSLNTTVEELMVAPPIYLEETNTIGDAVRTFTNSQITYIPIVNRGIVVVGLVSLTDLFSKSSKI